MPLLYLMAGLFIASALLTGLLWLVAPRIHLLDIPVERSAHSKPVAVGGGIGVVILCFLVVLYYSRSGLIPFEESMALLAALAIAFLGLIDDLTQLHIRWRIPMQFIAAMWVVWWLPIVPAINLGLFVIENPWVLTCLAVVALVWLLNLFNFMDGIDGIAGSELVFVNLLSLLVVINSGDDVLALLSATFAATAAGFLLWNWSPAKIFMGDVGSGFAGFSLGIMALLSMQHGSMTVWTWVLLLGVFIVDTAVTLLTRFRQNQRWYDGHASHAYQNAARRYQSHSKVTITVILINCLWLAPLAWLSTNQPDWGIYLTLIGIVPLVLLAIKLEAGRTMDFKAIAKKLKSLNSKLI
ncbi:MAG: glycosyl transferase [SAR86 cluster bacterium]|uniref:Glycosyl transferase n=1 Tax=SAR86 cluster bacterium TaxID=2030880 RepID=A0A2A5BBE7_9GAMM|nr:MAG: glycosyl transferase [SAR86 cluster bacterium]